MVEVFMQGADVHFNVKGVHKLWAFKSRIQIPRIRIKAARQDAQVLKGWWKGWRAPGTHIPGLLAAGTFYQNEKRIFWDVHNAAKAIVVDLEHCEYHQLIIEVDNPEAVVALLNGPA